MKLYFNSVILHAFLSSADFFKINFFEIFFQEYHLNVNQFLIQIRPNSILPFKIHKMIIFLQWNFINFMEWSFSYNLIAKFSFNNTVQI